jgi:hypothetical protein
MTVTSISAAQIREVKPDHLLWRGKHYSTLAAVRHAGQNHRSRGKTNVEQEHAAIISAAAP